MSNLLEHAKTEMRAAGLYDKDADYGGMIPEAVEELVGVFAKQGHSGGSAGIVTAILNKVLKYQPLVPLSGKTEEWVDVADGVFQNKRCSHVFATGSNGEGAYDIEGKVFVEPNGCAYTGKDSRVSVTFPYTPKKEYVKVPAKQD